MLRAWEVADEVGQAWVAFGMRPGRESGRWIRIGRDGLRDGIGGLGSGQ